MKPFGRPLVGPKAGPPAPTVSPRKGPDGYMQEVVDLKDMRGSVLFRGTRQECRELIRKRAELRERNRCTSEAAIAAALY